MTIIRTNLFTVLVILFLSISMFSVPVAAQNEGAPDLGTDTGFNIIPSEACEGEAANSEICKNNVDQGVDNNALVGEAGILTRVANLLAVIVGIAAVIAVIIGGFQYALSGGDSSKVNTAKNTIIYALVGVVVTVLARQIILFVIGKFA